MSIVLAFFQDAPGLTDKVIPGLPITWIPEKGMVEALKLFEQTNKAGIILLGLLLIVTLALPTLGLGQKWTADRALYQAIGALLLIVGFKVLFGGIMGAGGGVAERIIPKEEISKINEDIRDKARQRQEEKGKNEPSASDAWYVALAVATAVINPLTAALPDLILALATTIFYASSVVIVFLWRVFAIILFVCGPLVLALGSIPGYGAKIITTYFGAIVQVAAWQIWFAVCTFFVRYGKEFFAYDFTSATDFKNSALTHFESIGICLVFAVMYLGTPFLVSAILPISRFSTAATSGFLAAGGAVVGVGTAVVGTIRDAATLIITKGKTR